MKRLLVLLLALGFVVATDHRTWADKEDPKEEKKDDKKKDDKKDKDEKKEVKKDKDAKKEEKKDKEEAKVSDEQKKDLEKLTGTFEVTTFERDGMKDPAEKLKKMKVVQKAAEWTFYMGEDETKGKDSVMPDKNPKQIDSTYTNGSEKGKTVKGIYKIDGDTITYCWAEPDKERPTAFETKSGSKLTLMVLKKVTEKKPEDKPKDKDKEKDKPKDKDKEKDK